MTARLLTGDCAQLMRAMPPDSFDSIVTDAPYGMSDPPDIAEVLRHWLPEDPRIVSAIVDLLRIRAAARAGGFWPAVAVHTTAALHKLIAVVRDSRSAYKHGKPGFMGAAWDSFVPGPQVWAEALRVAKPGAHALVFASTRTVDLMGIACRLAGWEVRDTLHWLHYQGQPHGLDVSKAIDKMRYDREQILEVTRWIAETRDAAGITNRAIDAAFGTNGMAGHWTSQKSQPAVPTLDQVPALLVALGNPDVPADIQRLLLDLNGAKGQPGAAWFDREVVGQGYRVDLGGGTTPNARISTGAYDITAAATEDAAKWEGWNTALKPSIEPILLLRKPLGESTVAANVLRWGTGAINIDGSRIPQGSNIWPGPQKETAEERDHRLREPWGVMGKSGIYGHSAGYVAKAHPKGRYPANLLHFKKPSRAEKEAGCEALPIMFKPDTRNGHKTVKPIALMRYLCRLVTPPGGDILDCFMGSGTTGIGAKLEGFDFTGCELDAAFIDISRARIKHAAPGQEVEGGTDPEPPKWSQVSLF